MVFGGIVLQAKLFSLAKVRTVIQKPIEGSSAAAAKAKNIGNTTFMPS